MVWFYSAFWTGFTPPLTAETRRGLSDFLNANGIDTRPVVCGNIARQPALRNVVHRVSGELKGADEIMDRGLYWGLYPQLTDAQVEHVLDTTMKYFGS